MDLLSFLPSSSELNADAFATWDGKNPSKRLVLSVPHSVSARIGLSEVSGSSDVHYVVEAPDPSPSVSGALTVRRGIAYVGAQSPDVIRMLMEDLRPRTSYSVASVSQGIFDLRCLAYVCGVAVASGASNLDVKYPRDISSMRLLSPSWSVPVAGELTIGPGIASSGREFVTLALLTKAAGMPRLQLMADLLPNTSEAPHQGPELAGFAFKLFANIMSAAQGCACGTHHLLAFYRGMCSAWSLWSHTDEGGWIRKALARALYPPGAGILAVTTDEFMSLPLKSRMDPADVTKVAIGLHLVCSSAIPIADAYTDGKPTVFEKTGDMDRPSAFEGLSDRFYEVLLTWRDLMGPVFGLHPSSISDRYSANEYFADDKVDSHFSFTAILPFWYVEPGPVYSYDSGKVPLPCKRGTTVNLRLLECEGYCAPDIGRMRSGGYARGVSVDLLMPPGSLRMSGISYIFSSQYSQANGLSYMSYKQHPETGRFETDGLFAPSGVTNLADRRWITPHNPIMNPIEGTFRSGTCISYTYLGRVSEPSLEDWERGVVQSTTGFFMLNEDPGSFNVVTHHTVPPRYRRYTRWLHATQMDESSKVVTFFGGETTVASTLPSPPPDPEPPNSEPVEQVIEIPTAPPPSAEKVEPRRVPVTTDVGDKQGTGTMHPQPDTGTGSV